MFRPTVLMLRRPGLWLGFFWMFTATGVTLWLVRFPAVINLTKMEFRVVTLLSM